MEFHRINPDCDPEDRFALHPLKKGRAEYTIQDQDLGMLVPVPVAYLQDPKFDLVTWYKGYLDKHNAYQRAYSKTYQRLHELDKIPAIAREPTNVDLDVEFEYIQADVEDELPALLPLSDSEDEDEGESEENGWKRSPNPAEQEREDTLLDRVEKTLTQCCPFLGDEIPVDPTYCRGDPRFCLSRLECELLEIYNRVQGMETQIHLDLIGWGDFSVGRWYTERCAAIRNHGDVPANG